MKYSLHIALTYLFLISLVSCKNEEEKQDAKAKEFIANQRPIFISKHKADVGLNNVEPEATTAYCDSILKRNPIQYLEDINIVDIYQENHLYNITISDLSERYFIKLNVTQQQYLKLLSKTHKLAGPTSSMFIISLNKLNRTGYHLSHYRDGEGEFLESENAFIGTGILIDFDIF